MSGTQPRFTGRKRRLKTPWTVRFSDVASEGIITIGGIGTIVAVCLVALVLVMEVVPLFRGGETSPITFKQTPWDSSEIVHFQMNDYQTIAWLLTRDGTLQSVRVTPPQQAEKRGSADPSQLEELEIVHELKLFEEGSITSISQTSGSDSVLLGLSDGTIRVCDFPFETIFIDPVEFMEWQADQPEDAPTLKVPGDTVVYNDGVVQLSPQGQFRLERLVPEIGDAISIAETPITLIEHDAVAAAGSGVGGSEIRFAIATEQGDLKLGVINQKKSLLTGKVKVTKDVYDLAKPKDTGSPIRFLKVPGLGKYVYAVTEDGLLSRYQCQDLDNIQLVETIDLIPESDSKVTVCSWILGRETLFVGDEAGNYSGWFQIRLADRKDDEFAGRESADGFTLAKAHTFESGPAAVSSFGASSRSRMFVVGFANGSCRLHHMTTEKLVVEMTNQSGKPIEYAWLAPRDNGLILESEGQLAHYKLEPGFPDITLASLFLPVWYEGYPAPLNMWQSSSSKNEDELKYSLLPLISGTAKATLYSMLFGAPIALLAAIYTSEFSSRKTRTFVKPTVEMMASLPSVVLGFVAALVFAPVVERIVPSCLTALFLVPLVALVAAYLWQLLPRKATLILQSYRLWFLIPTLLLGIYTSFQLGPVVERWMFLGDIKYWLVHPEEGNGIGGWLLILIPLSAVILFIADTYWFSSIWRATAATLPREKFVALGLIKFTVLTLLTLGLAFAMGGILELAGIDPRGTFIGEYDQRNSLIVGFVMGFAVIPIVYTIADDALSTVPSHLRSASLGCGATPWQTTVRVVIPTAMSGLFSAMMIGLGRVAGETMIVLMAGGNTPIQDWNIFNGFRTLSTNIAIELPEAVQGSSHYRVLFLSALVLFLLTFFVNTVAEIVRLYFRRRAYQL